MGDTAVGSGARATLRRPVVGDNGRLAHTDALGHTPTLRARYRALVVLGDGTRTGDRDGV